MASAPGPVPDPSGFFSQVAAAGGWRPGGGDAAVQQAFQQARGQLGSPSAGQLGPAPAWRPPQSPQDQFQAYQRAQALLQALVQLYSSQDPLFLRGYGRQ